MLVGGVTSWATAHYLIQHTQCPTWGRGDKESTLDLAFTNDLTRWIPDRLNHAQLGSVNDMVVGIITTNVPATHVYRNVDWEKWEAYPDKAWECSPAYHNEAYKHSYTSPSRTKVACSRGKKWWDKELDGQLKLTRRAKGEDRKKESGQA